MLWLYIVHIVHAEESFVQCLVDRKMFPPRKRSWQSKIRHGLPSEERGVFQESHLHLCWNHRIITAFTILCRWTVGRSWCTGALQMNYVVAWQGNYKSSAKRCFFCCLCSLCWFFLWAGRHSNGKSWVQSSLHRMTTWRDHVARARLSLPFVQDFPIKMNVFCQLPEHVASRESWLAADLIVTRWLWTLKWHDCSWLKQLLFHSVGDEKTLCSPK